MKTEMSPGGIGPKLALISLPFIILSLVIMYMYPGFFNLEFLDNRYAQFAGGLLLGLGLVLWGASAATFITGYKKGRLITRGPYSLCRNPIYSSVILFMIPGIGLVHHSGLILSIALVIYINFKVSIHGESRVLSRIFGEEYEHYSKTVNELFPVPKPNYRKHNRIKETAQ
jgi:protein-S-isoprenylcysteine O-methyltransferase Ste14